MGYTRNQHMLSQWFLRNFRSDDTALSSKEKRDTLMALTAEQINRRQQLVATGTFNVHTLLPGEEWVRAEIVDVRHVLSLIALNDMQLADRLHVTERTVRKWRSGETRMVFTTWCCLCQVAGLGSLLE